MSHYRVKTKYNVEGPYGSVEESTLYAHLNLSCDVTTFFDEDGTYIFSVEDTMDNNIFDAMKRLFSPHKDLRSTNLLDGVEYMTPEESKKCGI